LEADKILESTEPKSISCFYRVHITDVLAKLEALIRSKLVAWAVKSATMTGRLFCEVSTIKHVTYCMKFFYQHTFQAVTYLLFQTFAFLCCWLLDGIGSFSKNLITMQHSVPSVIIKVACD
jgi:hypothetical protein